MFKDIDEIYNYIGQSKHNLADMNKLIKQDMQGPMTQLLLLLRSN